MRMLLISKFKIFFILLLSILPFNSAVKCQEIKELSIVGHKYCSFSGREWENELFQYPLNPKVEAWIQQILTAGGVKKNFTVIQANVENIAAVYDPYTGNRYLLYSQHFIENSATKLEVFGALAHEIGHHVIGHKMHQGDEKFEELEADEFMGYILAGIAPLKESLTIIDLLPSFNKNISDDERRMAIRSGWRRAELQMNINSAPFDTDPDREEFLKSSFPYPPPPCCSPIPIERKYFQQANNLGKVAEKLCAVLNERGYRYRRYMSFPGGFALVTQMEQFNSDYYSLSGTNRWASLPVCETFDDFFDYFKRLIFAEKAFFRVFVFIVTDKTYKIKGNQVTKTEAESWFSSGVNKLPDSIAGTPYTDRISVEAIVYEFEVPQSNKKPLQKCPSIDTYKHLQVSGILSALNKK